MTRNLQLLSVDRIALKMYNLLLDEVKSLNVKKVAKGNFGNYMEIETSLNGPFNLFLESEGR